MSLAGAVRSSLVILAVPVLASAAGVKRKVAVPDHGAFEISLPSGWRYSTELPERTAVLKALGEAKHLGTPL
jgi:hypothetical protein